MVSCIFARTCRSLSVESNFQQTLGLFESMECFLVETLKLRYNKRLRSHHSAIVNQGSSIKVAVSYRNFE